MRAATGLLDKSNFDYFINTIFKAIWIDGLNMGDEMVLQKVLSDNNFNSQDLFKLASTDSVKEILIANTDSAVRRGLFGVPTIFINGEMFFGQDRLEFVYREAKK